MSVIGSRSLSEHGLTDMFPRSYQGVQLIRSGEHVGQSVFREASGSDDSVRLASIEDGGGGLFDRASDDGERRNVASGDRTMPVHQVPHRDVGLTELGLGAAQFGNLYRETTEEGAAGALDAAWRAGIRYLDRKSTRLNSSHA